MKITVITVCRNAVVTIRECVESVASQSHPDVEHWIIDGASTDGTAQVLAAMREEYGFRLISEPDGGLYEAMNKGLSRATGEVVGFLNADDRYAHPAVLDEVAAAFRDPEVDACYADLRYVDQYDGDRVRRNWISDAYEPGAFFRGWMPPHPTFFARRGVYEKFGGFDTTYRFGADWELLFRLFEIKRIGTVYVPRLWVVMRLGGATNRSWRNRLANHRECLAAFRRHGCRAGLAFPFRKAVHRWRQFRWRRPKS